MSPTEHADGLVARPNRQTRAGGAVVHGELSVVQRAADPGNKVVVVGHVDSMLVKESANNPPDAYQETHCRAAVTCDSAD
jgi:hypothetical protein